MDLKDRLKLIREKLNKTQREFCHDIGMKQSTYAMYEVGTNKTPLRDSYIQLICNTYNISEHWLRTNEGEMFIDMPQDELARLAERYNLPPLAQKIIETFITLNEHEMNAVLTKVRGFVQEIYDVEDSTTKNKEYIDRVAEEKATLSLSSRPQK